MGSRQKHFYLPEPQTDFIFSIITEEFGFIGALVVISLFIILYYNITKLAIRCNDLFGKYLIFGLLFLLVFQTLLNLSVVVGLVPITGVTLPFISYGGSSLLVSMISIGIILNISDNIFIKLFPSNSLQFIALETMFGVSNSSAYKQIGSNNKNINSILKTFFFIICLSMHYIITQI